MPRTEQGLGVAGGTVPIKFSGWGCGEKEAFAAGAAGAGGEAEERTGLNAGAGAC